MFPGHNRLLKKSFRASGGCELLRLRCTQLPYFSEYGAFARLSGATLARPLASEIFFQQPVNHFSRFLFFIAAFTLAIAAGISHAGTNETQDFVLDPKVKKSSI